VNHAVYFDLRAPEAVPDFFVWIKLAQIQLPPAVHPRETKEILDGVRFVLAMWPEPAQRCDEF
jgi:hypothetical protein